MPLIMTVHVLFLESMTTDLQLMEKFAVYFIEGTISRESVDGATRSGNDDA